MAELLTTYKKIKNIRSDLKDICKALQNAVNTFPTGTYQTKGSARLSAHGYLVAAMFNSAEKNLTEAHKAANALGSVKSNPKASKLTFSISRYSVSNGIKVKTEDAMSNVATINKTVTKLEGLKGIIDKCYREIDSLNVTEQFVSSLTVIDFLFPISGLSKYAQIATVKTIGTTNLKQAKTDVGKLIDYFKELSKNLTKSINQFSTCEKAVKSKSYEKVIATTSTITESSNTPNNEIKDKINELEEKQKEYIYLYGEECPEIAEEIARLKKLYGTEAINLSPNMGNYSMKQGDYGAFTIPYGYNAGCCATAYAIGLSITRGTPYNPTSFWNQSQGLTYYSAGGIGAYQGFNASSVYEALKNGKPTMFHYYYTNKRGYSSQHWVVITGIREGADPNNLSYRDFMAIDPGSGTLKSLADIADSNSSFSIQGMKIFT